MAIQIAHKRYGQIVRIEHIGSAHDAKEEAFLVGLAHQRLNKNQLFLFKSTSHSPKLILKSSSSILLSETLLKSYDRLGFTKLKDHVFAFLTIARIVEPVSKLDSLRVLEELGVINIRLKCQNVCLYKEL